MAGSYGEDVHRGTVRTWLPVTVTAMTLSHRGRNSCLPSPTRAHGTAVLSREGNGHCCWVTLSPGGGGPFLALG